ncbi:MAG: hypothetical protein KJZ85_10640 [Rhodobacteraceae bacterium]|nr:hypothetical protein [Paracoccaceae bacterium]
MQPMNELELKLYLKDLDRQAIAARASPGASGGWLSRMIRRLPWPVKPEKPIIGAGTPATR